MNAVELNPRSRAKAPNHRFGHLHFLFLSSFFVVGWALLIGLTFAPRAGMRHLQWNPELLGCLALGSAVRLLPIRVFERGRIVLDMAFYVAAAFAFGLLASAWLACINATFDVSMRFVRGTGPWHYREAKLRYTLLQVGYSGGLPVLLLLALGLCFNVDHNAWFSDVVLAWKVLGFATAFVVVHYAIALFEHWLLGTASHDLLRGFVWRTAAAELLLVPLALAMVLGYLHQGPFLFFLLGSTSVLFSAIYRRAAIAGFRQRQRVQELATLNKVGRIIAGSLERRPLVANIARETLRLVKQTSRFMIGTPEARATTVLYDLFDENGHCYKRSEAPRDEGLSGWIMQHRKPLLLNDVQREYHLFSKTMRYNDPRFHSWLGVPLVIQDEVVGVISVQSEQRHAYTKHQLRVLNMIGDQAAVALENARLYELATMDGLTSVYVRRYFDQRLQEEWDRSVRHQTPFVLGLIDIDNFKNFNDTYGHQAGDAALKAAAAVIRRGLRTIDLAARYGGEEFAIILPRTNLTLATQVSERLLRDLATMRVWINGQALQITASMGLSSGPDANGLGVAEMLERADRALYVAKSRGKNRVVVNEKSQDPEVHPGEGGLQGTYTEAALDDASLAGGSAALLDACKNSGYRFE